MKIDTNSEFDQLDDHPTFQELSEEEKGLYWSTLKAMAEAARTVKEYREQHEEIDLDDPELDGCIEKVQTAVALSEVLDEIAARRRRGITLDPGGETLLPNIEFEPVGSRMEGQIDE